MQKQQQRASKSYQDECLLEAVQCFNDVVYREFHSRTYYDFILYMSFVFLPEDLRGIRKLFGCF